jgi:hypothetical protein
VNQATYGVVDDDFTEFSGVHPDTLNRYHGAQGEPIHRRFHQTGAGHPSDDDEGSSSSEGSDIDLQENVHGPGFDEEDADLQGQIAADIRDNVHHKPVKVPQSRIPFTDPTHEIWFSAALNDIRIAGLVPPGYGVCPSEWDEDGYPRHEMITFGRRKKEFIIDLPEAIWLPRAITWVQGLHTLQSILYSLGDE